jgi:hypothetical protein
MLSAFDDYTVDEQRRGEYWSADVRPIRPSPGSGTTVLVNGVRDDTVPHPIMFEGGDPELMVAALERLARTCGVLILRAETSYRALVVRAGSDPRAVLDLGAFHLRPDIAKQRRIAMPPNKGMKQTKPAQAMELRSLSPVLGGP